MGVIAKLFLAVHEVVYRLSRGRAMGRFQGMPVLLLTTKGRKSGKRRTAPLLYLQETEVYYVVGSMGGAPTHPAWYLNLAHDPSVTVQVKGRVFAANAEQVEAAERERLWERFVAGYSGYASYVEKTERVFPIIALSPTLVS